MLIILLSIFPLLVIMELYSCVCASIQSGAVGEGQSSANVWKGALAWREAAECRDLYLSLPRPPAPGRRDGCRGRSGEEMDPRMWVGRC